MGRLRVLVLRGWWGCVGGGGGVGGGRRGGLRGFLMLSVLAICSAFCNFLLRDFSVEYSGLRNGHVGRWGLSGGFEVPLWGF